MRLAAIVFIGSILLSCSPSSEHVKIVFRPAPETGTITRWIDGDTCVISVDSGDGLTWEERVRLYGIWVPELDEEGGQSARSEMIEKWPAGSSIQLEYPERSKERIVYRDSFGRLLAILHRLQKEGRK